MIIIGLIIWIIEKIKESVELKHAPAPAPCRVRDGYGYHISPAVWERSKGINPTGKFNDVC